MYFLNDKKRRGVRVICYDVDGNDNSSNNGNCEWEE